MNGSYRAGARSSDSGFQHVKLGASYRPAESKLQVARLDGDVNVDQETSDHDVLATAVYGI